MSASAPAAEVALEWIPQVGAPVSGRNSPCKRRHARASCSNRSAYSNANAITAKGKDYEIAKVLIFD